jgi:hypothetical protein
MIKVSKVIEKYRFISLPLKVVRLGACVRAPFQRRALWRLLLGRTVVAG